MNKNPMIVIPAYKPCKDWMARLRVLLEHGLKIIVVNDGSDSDFETVFKHIESMGVMVIHHKKNKGKGAALKTGMNYYLKHFSASHSGVITCDADGQHDFSDIKRLTDYMTCNENTVFLGVRQFRWESTPFRSWFGNQITRQLFYYLTTKKLHDTQTGLRGLPLSCVIDAVKIPHDGFDFEMVMLKHITDHCAFEQIPIKTIYLKNNESSHFDVLHDSIRVYRALFALYYKRST